MTRLETTEDYDCYPHNYVLQICWVYSECISDSTFNFHGLIIKCHAGFIITIPHYRKNYLLIPSKTLNC